MDFFLEIHNGECRLGGHFCDNQRDHGPSVLIQPLEATVRSNKRMLERLRNRNQGFCFEIGSLPKIRSLAKIFEI